ncbi:prolyl-tRNA synthetase associated domain-containing protein [Geminicoccaceae bacterium 1502E]|nr:prolyl-tRNA synthetase associated domain-containing protein [Geminicoccaceae bacterium 1502E]
MLRETDDLLSFLRDLDIEAATVHHPPVFTVEEAREHTHHLPGGHTKNLFLEDRKGGLWLVTCLDAQIVKVNALARLLEAPRFSFASAERLGEVLGVEPGSVTPFALVNDRERRVRPVLDEKMLRCELLNFHPLRNTATTTVAAADLLRFMAATGHEPLVLDLDATASA